MNVSSDFISKYELDYLRGDQYKRCAYLNLRDNGDNKIDLTNCYNDRHPYICKYSKLIRLDLNIRYITKFQQIFVIKFWTVATITQAVGETASASICFTKSRSSVGVVFFTMANDAKNVKFDNSVLSNFRNLK